MKKFFHYTIFFINSFVLLGIFFSLISPFINPNVFWLISFFGLFFPIFVITLSVFSVFWFFYNKKYMWINLVFLLLSSPYISRFVSINSSDNTGEEINIMSYNVRLFNNYDKQLEYGENVDEEIINYVNTVEIDIFCIQEYYNPKKDLNFNFKCSTIDREGSKENQHMAIYSNYEIINDTINSGMEDIHNTCIFSDIIIKTDTIRVYNIHLASNFFNRNDIKFMSSPELEQEKIKRGIFGITKRLKRSFEARGKEVQQIKKHIDNSPHPTIICGDFNDTPVSYAYQELGEKKLDGFLESGNGFGATFTKIPFLRIDYILYDQQFSSSDFITHQKILSDHRAVSCKIKLD